MFTDHDSGPVVIDNGSGCIKAGFAGADGPVSVFPTIIGSLQQTFSEFSNNKRKKVYFGEEAFSQRDVLDVKHVVKNGIITDFNYMEMLLNYTFENVLGVTPKNHGILISEAPLSGSKNREKLTEMMFEKFDVPNFYGSIQGQLSLFASGRTTGIVIDVGYGVNYCLPVYEGYPLPHAIKSLDISGEDLTNYLEKLLNKRGLKFKTLKEKDIVNDIKERLAYISFDYEKEIEKSKEKKNDINSAYQLPDGQTMVIKNERFECSEPLFNPSLLNIDQEGIDKLTYSSIVTCHVDIRRELYTNIVLSGGSTMFCGIAERIQKEIKQLAPESITVKIIAPPERKYSAWIGGSILSALSTFEDEWISEREYQEFGPSIIHKKCT